MLSDKQREKMERQRAASSMAAASAAAKPCAAVAGANAKIPLASVQSSQSVARVSSDSRASADDNAKARARESARASGVARSTMGPGPSLAAASSRAQKESQKLAAEHNSGPSLAPAISGAILPNNAPPSSLQSIASSSAPGAFASSRASSGEVMKQRANEAGPSLAPAEFSSVPSAPIESAPVFVPSSESEQVHIGAYAIEGMDAHHDDLSDDEFSITDQNRPYVHDVENGGYDDVFYVDPDAAQTMENALEAELQVVVDGNILTEDDEEPLDPKAKKRLRMYQAGVFCFSCAAIALMIGAILGFADTATPIAPGWLQAGPTLYGSQKDPQVFFGQSVDMNGNGTRIVVAAPGFDDEITHNKIGQVRIFDQIDGANGTEWQKVGVITGEELTSAVQMSVSMSKDGHIIAVGRSHVGQGVVEVFDEKDNGWILNQNFSLPVANGTETWFGYVVALSPDGSVLVVSAPLADTPSGAKSGLVRVYQRTGSDWAQLGQDIAGSSDNELFGWSITVQVGSVIRVVAGSPSSDGEKGQVGVFDWTGSAWKPNGATLKGVSSLGRFGESVALSGDGRVLAVGASGTAFMVGSVKVYRLSSGEWAEDGHSFLGLDPSESFGMAVSLSSDGTVLAVGSGHADEEAGRINVYAYDEVNGAWADEGLPIEGSSGDDFGSTVALSSVGRRVLGGAPSAMYNGKVAQAGAVRVYDRDESELE